MINVTKADREFIEKEIPKGAALLAGDDLDALLDELAVLLMVKGIGRDHWPNEFGDKIADVDLRLRDMN
ncbi:MAG: hypothetical protein LBR44_03320 [Clostridiales Family XIII bacterium]|jgi:hypothetical protein|nr:hypothetical protein [Clostridiales Family XIII bacterium]